MTIDNEILVGGGSVVIIIIGAVIRLYTLQQKQNDAIAANKDSITQINKRIGEQSKYNIKTEKQVEVMIAEMGHLKDDVSEMKKDVKTLLTLLAGAGANTKILEGGE